eukprot:gene57685-biopygen77990
MASRGGCYFCCGKAGSGKSSTVRVFGAGKRSRGSLGMFVGSTGVVSMSHEGHDGPYASTVHSTMGVPVVPSGEAVGDLVSLIEEGTALASLLAVIEWLVWDEWAAAHRKVWECVDRLLKMLKRSRLPMGGIVFVACGDMRQTCDGDSPLGRHFDPAAHSTHWATRACFGPHNATADEINSAFLANVPGDPHTYTAFDQVMSEEAADRSASASNVVELADDKRPSGVPPRLVVFKQHAVVYSG